MSYYPITSISSLQRGHRPGPLPPATAGRKDHRAMPDDLAEQEPVLASAEADRRRALLARLQDELATHGFQSVLVGRQVLALRDRGPAPPSRRNPELHVSGPGQCRVVTTD